MADPKPILRKVCAGCEKIAEPYDVDENHRNEYGNLGGWRYSQRCWWCPSCTPRPAE